VFLWGEAVGDDGVALRREGGREGGKGEGGRERENWKAQGLSDQIAQIQITEHTHKKELERDGREEGGEKYQKKTGPPMMNMIYMGENDRRRRRRSKPPKKRK